MPGKYPVLGAIVDAKDDPVDVIFPGYDPNAVIQVPWGILESAGVILGRHTHFGAVVNLGADSPEDLNPTEFSSVEVTDDEASDIWDS